jgi:hypothetical protein
VIIKKDNAERLGEGITQNLCYFPLFYASFLSPPVFRFLFIDVLCTGLDKNVLNMILCR